MIERLTFYERSYERVFPKWRREPSKGESRILRGVATLLVCWVISGCQEQILHDLSEAEANKVLSRLSSSGSSADKVLQSDGRWAISVPRDKVLPALSFLDTHRVLSSREGDPKPKSQSGLVPSREEQWFRYERSVSQSIEDSLTTMQGVLEARVHLHLPESDPLFGTRRDDRGSGSVLMVIDPRFQAKDEELAALVAGAAGISATQVRVLRSTAPAARHESPAEVAVVEPLEARPAVSGDQVPIDLSRAASDSTVTRRVEVGIASVVGAGIAALGALLVRRRKPRTRFTLPTGDPEEE